MQNSTTDQYVEHSQDGFVVINESKANRTAIDFDFHGIKTFVFSPVVVGPPKRVIAERFRPKRRKNGAPTPNSAVFLKGAK